MEFRELRADEIEVRVQSIRKNNQGKVYALFLLYKDARCDMNILDETVGCERWKRSHELINGNLFCNVSIYDEDTHEWITKQDVGTESNTEKEKGQASDSFKRACVNWGIGRELYTAPSIMVYLNEGEYYEQKGKLGSYLKMRVKEIEYSDRKISKLVLVDQNNNVRYTFPRHQAKKQSQEQPKQSNGTNESNKDAVLVNEQQRSYMAQTIKDYYDAHKDTAFKPLLVSYMKQEKTKNISELSLKSLNELIVFIQSSVNQDNPS